MIEIHNEENYSMIIKQTARNCPSYGLPRSYERGPVQAILSGLVCGKYFSQTTKRAIPIRAGDLSL